MDVRTYARPAAWRLVCELAAALAAIALWAAPVPAPAREVAGAKLPDTITVGGKELALNGAGLRKKWIVKVYAGALYLAAPSGDAEAIVAADEPKAVRMAFLHDVSVYQMMNAFREGFDANNGKEEAKELKVKLRPVEQALVDLKPGSVLLVSYVPGEGSTIQVEGHPGITIAGKEFADALFKNWLGAKPADGDLKKGMLGG